MFVWQEWGSQSKTEQNVRHPSLSRRKWMFDRKSLRFSEQGPLQNYLYPSTSAAGRVCEMGRSFAQSLQTDTRGSSIPLNYSSRTIQSSGESFEVLASGAHCESELSLKLGRYPLALRECISVSIRAKVCLSNRRGRGGISHSNSAQPSRSNASWTCNPVVKRACITFAFIVWISAEVYLN